MQQSGIPTKTHQKGYVARHMDTVVYPTFQIKTFSTELKNHVMVMDFVKRNWFPSQRRAKVCIIHMYQGLKTAEQTASRYEIHSRLFSSPRDHSAWERKESLSNAGLRDSQYSPHDQIALKNLQSGVPEKRSDFTEGTLASQNTKMISSIVISQLIDENKSKENGAALPVPCAYPMKPSLANRSRVTINRAFEFLPGGLGVQTPVGEPGLKTKPPPKEEKPCSGSQKGFASITITARRVGPPASTLMWEAVGDPLCVKCRARDALLGDPSALAGGADPTQHHGPFTCTEFSRNSCVMGLKVPEAHAQLCEGHGYWITNVDHREDQFSPGTSRSRAGKSPLVFSSCVHLRVSQSCPNPIYYLDRSLSVPVEPPQLAGPKMHRSVLSLNLSCSSHRLTPDGVDDTENREPGSGALKPELQEGDQDLLGPRWNLGLQGSFLKENPSLGQMGFRNLEAGRCPWRGFPPSENAEAGTNQITMRKRKEDLATRCPTRGHNQANQLSIHIPGWSYTAGDYTCCDLVVKIKECKESEHPTNPESKPAPAEPAPPEDPETHVLPEDCSESQQGPESSLTLQEALEVRKPQFISRSQERLKKLEHMVQQRKAQRKETLAPKQSLLPVRAHKKQVTIPHPLSDNLFKPKERYISEKEMHMRSKRIYNNLPEVRKKKEEQKKRVILQSNRLRAEVFKKQLLDQLLQRNAV
ncbi:(E2-independent) E3 ubiquitin-conjugating enzyme FATS isoform X2 [Bos indicus x Bos taurus]|uniref:(E2-independent) E3 ubiquitin-conjugating enzyme FATS isoform X2 n=1 Tax=Bos indicus x Bos taurus TaxID=30522 RepID=UPI000F7D556E|nr:(E2-independent) E3 ubiquitin-conjugating enzyme FATS isoform X2 [Bos indicus x Bos taurus]